MTIDIRASYLAFGDFTALEVLIGRGGAPVVRRPLLPFGTAPLLSTLFGGVGAQEEVEEWECECSLVLDAGAVELPDTRESREEARVRVCGGLSSWWQSHEHSSGLTIFVPFGLRIASR